jgi:hypothetical protein
MSEHHSSKVDAAKRLAELRQESAEPAANEADDGLEFEPEDAEDNSAAAFSVISADRQRKIMCEFRMLNGNSHSLAYSFLVGAEFDSSKGIQLDFSGYAVTIEGRNLRPGYNGLISHRVAVVRQNDDLQAEATLPEDSAVITKIEIKEVE